MASEKSSVRHRVYSLYPLFFISLVVVAIGIQMLSGPGTQFDELDSRTADLEKVNIALTNQVESLQGEIRSLSAQLKSLTFSNESSNQLVDLYKHIANSVVLVENRVMYRGFLIQQSLGSGFVYSQDGYIITNNHVIAGANELAVTFLDGNATKATVIGTDSYSDIAIIKLTESLPWLIPLPLGDSSMLQVGETVVAIGSPFGLGSTMTSGIISQVGRELETAEGYKIVDVIQHDVPINPGNSGGPLLNLKGEVVGINTAIASSSGTYSGVGFAIPSDTIAREASELITARTYGHPYLGISGVEMSADIAEAADLNMTWGFLVTDVVSGGPSDRAGLRGGNIDKIILGQRMRLGGDLIVSVDGRRVQHLGDLFVYLERIKKPGDSVILEVIRNKQKFSITVLLGERRASQ